MNRIIRISSSSDEPRIVIHRIDSPSGAVYDSSPPPPPPGDEVRVSRRMMTDPLVIAFYVNADDSANPTTEAFFTLLHGSATEDARDPDNFNESYRKRIQEFGAVECYYFAYIERGEKINVYHGMQ